MLVGTLCFGPMACAAGHAESTAPVATASTAELSGLQARFAQVADRVTPSIVAISAVGTLPPLDRTADLGQCGWPALAAPLDRVSRTVGTGFVIDPDGYILTDEHVVADAEQIWITTDDQKVYAAMIVGSDPRTTWRY